MPGTALSLITRGQLVVIDEATDATVARRALDQAGLVGVLFEVDELVGVATLHQQAQEVHEYLRAARTPPTPLIENGEAHLLALLARAQRARHAEPAVTAILGELLHPRNAVLLDTLDHYLLAGNAVSAAHRMGIHAQTMRYRLKRLREITGRDPAHGWDRFVLELALRLAPRR